MLSLKHASTALDPAAPLPSTLPRAVAARLRCPRFDQAVLARLAFHRWRAARDPLGPNPLLDCPAVLVPCPQTPAPLLRAELARLIDELDQLARALAGRGIARLWLSSRTATLFAALAVDEQPGQSGQPNELTYVGLVVALQCPCRTPAGPGPRIACRAFTARELGAAQATPVPFSRAVPEDRGAATSSAPAS